MTINIRCNIKDEVAILVLYTDYKEKRITFDELKEKCKDYGAVVTAS